MEGGCPHAASFTLLQITSVDLVHPHLRHNACPVGFRYQLDLYEPLEPSLDVSHVPRIYEVPFRQGGISHEVYYQLDGAAKHVQYGGCAIPRDRRCPNQGRYDAGAVGWDG